MACFSTAIAPERRNPTAKNRVWDFFRLSNETHPANRRQPLQPRRKNRPTLTKTASGIPYWLSPDPIRETGGINLYQYVGGQPITYSDKTGLVWGIIADLAFMAWDTAQYSCGNISGKEYGGRMALNTAALALDVATAGSGAGTAMKLATVGGRTIAQSTHLAQGLHGAGAAISAVSHAANMQRGGASKWQDYMDDDYESEAFEKCPQGDNTAKNDEFKAALKELGIENNSDAARRLHEAITGKGCENMKDIVEMGRELGLAK